LNQVQQLEIAVDVEAQQKGLATSDELSRYYGNSEIASVYTNALACRYEDQLKEVIPYAQQLEQYAGSLQDYSGRLENLLTGPIGDLADYYMQREQIEAQYGNGVPSHYQPQSYEPIAPQFENYLPGGGIANLAPVPGVANFNMAAPGNALSDNAHISAQYAQNYATGIRPSLPQVPSGAPAQSMSIQSIPPSERYKMIDAAASNGMLRGLRFV